jgi:CheY-like chemotaxis protein
VQADDDGVPPDILLVEDEEDLRELLAARLRHSGYRVREAANGERALVELRSQPPEVMVADVGLPDMDGHDLARRVRADPSLSHVRLVALTGHAGPEAVAQAREAGFDLHLVKPTPLSVLLRALGPPRAR